MKPKKYIFPRKQSSDSVNKARLNKARAYANESPTIGNLFNAFINWFNGTKFLGGASDYITGNAPVGGRRALLLNLKQLKDLKVAALRAAARSKYEQEANDAFMLELEDVPVVIDGKKYMFPGRARLLLEAESDLYSQMADEWYYRNNPYNSYHPDYENWNPKEIYDTSIGFWPGVNMKELIR